MYVDDWFKASLHGVATSSFAKGLVPQTSSRLGIAAVDSTEVYLPGAVTQQAGPGR